MRSEDEYDRLLGGLSDALARPEPANAPALRPASLSISPRPVPARLDVAAIRRRTGLAQPAFARRIGVSLATLRNWEQGHRSPTGPARVLLALVERNPLIVEETLGGRCWALLAEHCLLLMAMCQSASKFDPRSASNSNPAGIDGMLPFCGALRSGS